MCVLMPIMHVIVTMQGIKMISTYLHSYGLAAAAASNEPKPRILLMGLRR